MNDLVSALRNRTLNTGVGTAAGMKGRKQEWRDVNTYNLRLLAQIELLVQNFDTAYFDGNICIGAILHTHRRG